MAKLSGCGRFATPGSIFFLFPITESRTALP